MKFAALLLFLLFFSPALALAAPYCIVNQNAIASCLYSDPVRCTIEAGKRRERCVFNPDSLFHLQGNQAFCLTQKNGVIDCQYADTETCNREADRKGAACLPRPQQNQQ